MTTISDIAHRPRVRSHTDTVGRVEGSPRVVDPGLGMVTTRFMELRRRRGLMIALIAVNIGIPVVFLAVRLISHAVDPKSFGPAGGYSVFTTLVVGFMYLFGFIVAAVVGCTAGVRWQCDRRNVPPRRDQRPISSGPLFGQDSRRSGHCDLHCGHRLHECVRSLCVCRPDPAEITTA